MKRPSGKLLILLLVAIIGAGVWYMTKKRPLGVEIARVEENIAVRVFGLGTVEARILSKIGFKVSNSIVELNADEGQGVRKGEVLARLDSSEQQARLAIARAGVAQAQAALISAGAALKKARSLFATKKRANRRKQTLFRKKTVSTEVAENAQLDADTAKAEVDIAQSNLVAAKAALVTKKAQLKLEKVSLDQYVLRAPFDAVVSRRHLELGTVAKAGEPLFTLVDPKTVWVLAHVSENRAGLIRLGQKAKIRLRSRPHNLYEGEVSRVDIESDRVTEERQVYLSCPGDCLQRFHLGEQAEVYITTAVLKEALFVPENAVDSFDERKMKGVVWSVEEGRLKRRNVIFGHRTLDARLSIASGLPDGAKVLVRLPKLLKEGRSATVRNPD